MTKTKLSLKTIKYYEGFSKMPYRDAVGIKTIGWGRTRGLMGETTLQAEEAWLRQEIKLIDEKINRWVVPKQTPSQMAALTSFIYNVGPYAFKSSTLLRKINTEDPGSSDEFLRWCKAGEKVLPGLVKRRMTEHLLYKRNTLVLF